MLTLTPRLLKSIDEWQKILQFIACGPDFQKWKKQIPKYKNFDLNAAVVEA